MNRLISKGELMSNKHIEINTERLFLRTITVDDAEMIKNFSDEFDNIASLHVIEKLGFTDCGNRIIPDENGADCDFLYFRLHKSNYNKGIIRGNVYDNA